MKTIKLAKRWLNRVNDTTVHEYPANSTATVSDETAERAVKAGVLDGDPVDAPDAKPAKVEKAKA
jgi:hypothetical protein